MTLLKSPAVISSVMLLLAFLDWNYGYYTFLRLIVTGTAVYYAYYLYTTIKEQTFWFWTLVGIAILFNPIIPVYLYDKSLWTIIDIIVASFFVVFILKYKK
jgi:hypothetical protein